MTSLPRKYSFTILGIYIALFIILGFINLNVLLWVLGILFSIGTFVYLTILIEEKPWKYGNAGENFLGYAIMAYGIVFFFIPIIILNFFEDRMERNEK